MKAELSHHGFIAEKEYSAVYLQQGTMITDRDWNALCDRLRQRFERLGAITAGTGAPAGGGLLSEFARKASSAWQARFAETGGWVVAEGVAGEAMRADNRIPFSYRNQRHLPVVPPLAGANILYADIWQQVVTAFDDPDLIDPALHGAHTSFVTRTIVQIKQCGKSQINETECGLQPDPARMPPIGTGKMNIDFREGPGGADACDPCAEAVNVDAETGNYLFRVEIHSVSYKADGTPDKATFKWSRENGATRYARDPDTGKIPNLDPGYAYEFFSEETEKYRGLHPTPAGTDFIIAGELHFGDLSGADPALPNIRRWDGFAELDLGNRSLIDGWDRQRTMVANGAPGTHGLVIHKNGTFTLNLEQVVVSLAIGLDSNTGERPALLAGDYWLARARTRAAEDLRLRMLSEAPIGVRHHYCILGVCEADGRTFEGLLPEDKRRLGFPELSCLAAEDIGYDNANCAYAKSEKATSVQEALDAFCKRLQPPYHTLRMSQGTGQEAPLDKRLPGPIEVVVEDQDGLPVRDVEVTFTMLEPNDGSPGTGVDLLSADPSMSQPDDKITVKTNAQGHAHIYWALRKIEGYRRVEAALNHTLGKNAPRVNFAANSAAEETEKPKLPRITKLEWVNGDEFRNDDIVPIKTLLRGFRVNFDEDMLSQFMSNDVVVLTAEVATKRESEINFLPMIVCSQVQETDKRFVTYVSDSRSIGDILDTYTSVVGSKADLPKCAPEQGLRFRIRIHGRFIFDDDGKRQLDGFVPGTLDGKRIALDYGNAGLGHASDFEAWFYIGYDEFLQNTPNKVDINKASLADLEALPGIGQLTAKRIVEGRPWARVSDLVAKQVISDLRLQAILDRVTV